MGKEVPPYHRRESPSKPLLKRIEYFTVMMQYLIHFSPKPNYLRIVIR